MTRADEAPILYVEDDDNDVLLLKFGARQANLRNPLFIVMNGRQAIDYLSGLGEFAHRDKYPVPALVLLDLNMPIVSGFDVLEWIRQQPQYAQLSVVVFTASNQEQDKQRAKSLGASDYAVKPTDLAKLPVLLKQISSRWIESQYA